MRLTLAKFNLKKLLFFHEGAKWPKELLVKVTADAIVKPDFITEPEEATLMKEVEPHMKRLKYEKEHWDDAIYLYREREHSRWNQENRKIIDRIQEASFPEGTRHLSHTHILDLAEDGNIRPHIDSVRYCGTTISGVSLLSDCVMRLKHKDLEVVVDLWLPRRSLYKLSNTARYEFSHAILDNEESEFDGQKIPKSRRISIICRDLPPVEAKDDKFEWTHLS